MNKWKACPFGDISKIAIGQIDPKEKPFCDYYHIGPENVQSDTGLLNLLSKSKDLGLISGKYLFDKEAIIYSKIRPNLNKVCLPNFIGICSADMYPIWPKKELIDRKYLFYFMKSPMFLKEAIASSTRTGLPKINRNDLIKIKVQFPESIEQQKMIASLLSTWDTAIEKIDRLIAAKESVKKGLMQRLLFGKIRLGDQKNSEFKEGKWFSVPSDWKRVKIGNIATEISKKNTNGNDLPVLSCTKYQGLVNSLEYFDKQIFSINTSTYKIVERGQFAYATNHIEEGSIGYQDLYPKGLISPMYTVFKTDPDKIHDGYLYKLLKTETFRRIFAINTNASVDRRGSLRWKDFSKLPIPLPSISEQKEINQVLDTAQQEIILLQKKLELLKTQKRGLMQKLLSGKWRVKKMVHQDMIGVTG